MLAPVPAHIALYQALLGAALDAAEVLEKVLFPRWALLEGPAEDAVLEYIVQNWRSYLKDHAGVKGVLIETAFVRSGTAAFLTTIDPPQPCVAW